MPKYGMRLDELTRPHDVTSAADVLDAAGYKQLGKGSFGTVFQKPGAPFVLKVFETIDHAYLKYIALCQSHQNEHFPRFQGKLIKVTDQYYAIRMEPLTRSFNSNMAYYIQTYMFYTAKEEVDSLNSIRFNKSVEYLAQHPSLKEACDLICKYVLPTSWPDVHADNIMMRGDVSVIIDPAA